MKTVSAILPAYNEEQFLPSVLANIEPYVDEIIVVDGGPNGASTDKTAEIAKACDKVKYFSNTFETETGGWDIGGQRNMALEHVTGDIMVVLSADMIIDNIELFRAALEEDYDVFAVNLIEFWVDMKHIRVDSMDTGYDILSTPSSNYKVIAVNSECDKFFDENGTLQIEDVEFDKVLYVSQAAVFHFGWIRPFKQQVAKHIRHIKMGAWGEEGAKLARGPHKDLEKWAIRHALTYRDCQYLEFYGKLPDCAEGLGDIRFDYGCNAVITDFEKKYGEKVLNYTHKKRSKNDK